MFYVFILFSPVVDRYFVGSTSNLEKSISRHNSGKNKHTKSGIPWNLVYKISFESRKESIKKEEEIISSPDRKHLIEHIKAKENEV